MRPDCSFPVSGSSKETERIVPPRPRVRAHALNFSGSTSGTLRFRAVAAGDARGSAREARQVAPPCPTERGPVRT